MRNLVGKGIDFIDEAIEASKHYYGTKVCGQCMFWESENWRCFPGHCTYREYVRDKGEEVLPHHGREPEEELPYQEPAENCLVWTD